MAQMDEKEEYDDFFAPKPLFGDDNNLGVIVSNSKRQDNADSKSDDDDSDEDSCEQEACIVDETGRVTQENYTLTNKDFKDWSINKITKKSRFTSYLNKTSKQLDESTPFWQFLKTKYPNKYNSIKQKGQKKVKDMIKTDAELIKTMSFDEITAIYLYTTNVLYTQLNTSLRSRQDEWAIFCGPLLSGISKLPFEWKPLYRGISYPEVVNRIRKVYEKDMILRWDSFSSTSTLEKVAKRFAGSNGAVFEIANGFRGRDIRKFSAFKKESEILFNISSHFVVTKKYEKTGDDRIYIKVKEIPFPWDAQTILWVDDKPTNNKQLIEKLERKGIMVIPRISTKGAIEFLDFMSSAITLSAFGKFRVITDMHRFEYEDDDTAEGKKCEDKEAGITLIQELRKRGYDNIVCIYCSRKKETIEKCKARAIYNEEKIIVTTQAKDVEKYGSFKDATDFNGIWELKTNENLDNFLKAQGVTYLKRKLMAITSITLTIQHVGNILRVKRQLTMGETNEEIILDGSEKETRNPAGEKIIISANWSDKRKTILIIKTNNLETKQLTTLKRRMCDENTLKDVYTNQDGVKMARIFQRKQ